MYGVPKRDPISSTATVREVTLHALGIFLLSLSYHDITTQQAANRKTTHISFLLKLSSTFGIALLVTLVQIRSQRL